MLFSFSFPVSFDHFEILRAIGRGSFGKVITYTSMHPQLWIKEEACTDDDRNLLDALRPVPAWWAKAWGRPA